MSASASTTVVVSTSAEVGSAYRLSEALVLVLGPQSCDTLLLTTGPEAVQSVVSEVVIVDGSHPIADGLPSSFAPVGGVSGLGSVSAS